MQDSYDCIVVGGGPGGCATAALTAQAGLSTLLVEREKTPRFHVGESLMPETYWPLKRLGVLEQMQTSPFVKKVSVQFVTSSGKESQPFFFKQHDPRENSQTWQVERADFDKMLFENAAAKGADCYDETRVLEPIFSGQRAVGVKLQTQDGKKREVRCRVLVDATGQTAFLAHRLALKVNDPTLQKTAIWSYFKNARRDPGEHGGATIILQTRDKKSWFWFIPLSGGITSIGVVADRGLLRKERGSPDAVFQQQLAECEVLSRWLADAQCNSRYHVAKEFSYATKQRSGDGWVLVGDAYGFIDPIYSSGVYFALYSGELAADAIIAGLKNDDTSAAQLGRWCAEFDAGANWIRKLVRAYYSKDFSFGGFMKEHPHYKADLTDLLIGRIFHDSAGQIFNDLDPWLDRLEADQPSRDQPTMKNS